MAQSKTIFDQTAISAIRANLLPFNTKVPLITSESTELLSYLDFYQLPEPHRELKLRIGKIESDHQSVVATSWTPKHANGSVIIVHGYMDHTGLFRHLIEHLIQCQLNVICFDLPGHGLSAGAPGFVSDYAEYVSALEKVIAVSQSMFDGPVQAIGQSMGGAILLKHLMAQNHGQQYPFTRVNLLAPLLEPHGWSLKRRLFLLTKGFRQFSKRQFRPSSYDQAFLQFVKQQDPFQPKLVPMAWVAALDKWIMEFNAFGGSDRPINLIQGSGDKTLNWQHNLQQFQHRLSRLEVQLIEQANHHLVNEIGPLRQQIFAALKL
jgi:alpha-beta hydrolase superfamily lysophospholipase